MSFLEKFVSEIPLVGGVVNNVEILLGQMTPQEAVKYKLHRQLTTTIGLTALIGTPIAAAFATVGIEIASSTKEDLDAWAMSLSKEDAMYFLASSFV